MMQPTLRERSDRVTASEASLDDWPCSNRARALHLYISFMTEESRVTTPAISSTVPEERCITVGGPGKGMACVFPFTFMGVTYDKCYYYLGKPTCATMVDDLGTVINYGYCGPNCPING